MLKEIRWTRPPNVELVLDADRKALVPLLRRTALDRIPILSHPVGIAFDGTSVGVTAKTGDTKLLDANSGQVVATISQWPAVAIATDGTNMWQAAYYQNAVVKFKPSGALEIILLTGGEGPSGLAFDGSHMWVTNS